MSDHQESADATSYAIGLDIGGTFTDIMLLDGRGGARVHKLLTTPDDPARAALQGVVEILAEAGVEIGAVDLVIHSTTLVTNALIQQQGARVGLLTTRGFRDVLEMRDEHRYDIYDLYLEWPSPLVPRERRLPITERLTRDGAVLEAPREDEVAAALDQLDEAGVDALAVSFLHAYKEPRHEHLVAEMVRRLRPNLPVTLSSDVAPVIREYERTSTAVADAFVRPLAQAYLTSMDDGLRAQGFRGQFYLMLSGGGSASVASARRHPIRLVESGPAAGALAAALYGRLTNHEALLAFDMGGTTAKACAIEGAAPTVVNVLEVARSHRFKAGSGMPLVVPSVELIEIGAGGGSIARIDNLGMLKVGPDSAGADPGPACYGRGGAQATVTDANLVLGYLDPHYFLGGRMSLDVDAARAAIGRLAQAAGLSVERAAWGIHQVVNENMAQAARAHLLEKNANPTTMTILAFGGAGPAHAAAVAKGIGIGRAIFPMGAGATSALGCLAAPLSFQSTRSLPGLLPSLDWDRVNALFGDLEQAGLEALAEAGVDVQHVTMVRELDARIAGQIHELTVPVPLGTLGPDTVATIQKSYAAAYRRLYSRFDEASTLEAVNWKLTARGPERALELRHAAPPNASDHPAQKGQRPAWFDDAYRDTPVYDRYLLSPGSSFDGPAIIEEREATVILPPGSHAVVDDYWNLVVDLHLRPATAFQHVGAERQAAPSLSAESGARA